MPSAAPPVGFDNSTCTPRVPWYLPSSNVVMLKDCWVMLGAKVSVPATGVYRARPRAGLGLVVYELSPGSLAACSALAVTVAVAPS